MVRKRVGVLEDSKKPRVAGTQCDWYELGGAKVGWAGRPYPVLWTMVEAIGRH